MSVTAYYMIALIVGAVAGAYLPLNSLFAQQVGSPLLATATFFVVGAVTAILAWLLFGGASSLTHLAKADLPLLLLGVVSFAIILSATFFIPKIGPGAYFVCLIAGQLIVGLALSHFGLFAAERLPMTPLKLFGAFAIVIGVMMVRFSEAEQRKSVAAAKPIEAAEIQRLR